MFDNSQINHLYHEGVLTLEFDGTAGALNFAWTVPTSYQDLSFYVSGELGYVWLGSTSSAGIYVPDYAHWNAGFGWTWKNLTLDLRFVSFQTNEIAKLCIVVFLASYLAENFAPLADAGVTPFRAVRRAWP